MKKNLFVILVLAFSLMSFAHDEATHVQWDEAHTKMVDEHKQWEKDHKEAEVILKKTMEALKLHRKLIKMHDKNIASHHKEIEKHRKGKEPKVEYQANLETKHNEFQSVHQGQSEKHQKYMKAIRDLEAVLH